MLPNHEAASIWAQIPGGERILPPQTALGAKTGVPKYYLPDTNSGSAATAPAPRVAVLSGAGRALIYISSSSGYTLSRIPRVLV